MSRPENIRTGIAYDEETGAHAVVMSGAIIGRYDTQLQALRALETADGSYLGSGAPESVLA